MKMFSFFGVCLVTTTLQCIPVQIFAQKKMAKSAKIERSPTDFPELITADIPGAPILGQPQLIMGEKNPVMAEGHGWAVPALYDYDGDGKKDLLIGEFGSGEENFRLLGSFLRVYQNLGTDQQPKFSDEFNYAKGYDRVGSGAPLSIYTWCCTGFTPRIADLNGDGKMDLITGQYEPGYVTWFKGSEKGFLPGEKLDQMADPLQIANNNMEGPRKETDITSINYWWFSTVAFGDIDDDGDLDMFVGGSSLRISENVGTKFSPQFSYRKKLLDINDQPLQIVNDDHKHMERFYDSIGVSKSEMLEAGGMCTPFVDDWDQDGVPDLFVTSVYGIKGDALITFFKGRKTQKGLRFEPGISLLSAKDHQKAFPGSNPFVTITDWNNDGVKDMVIGVNMTYLHGRFDPTISWGWEVESGTWKKNPGHYTPEELRMIESQKVKTKHMQDSLRMTSAELKQNGYLTMESLTENYFVKEEYRDMTHKGYVYVLLGKKKA